MLSKEEINRINEILSCESLAIDRCIEKIKSSSDTLSYFCESEEK